ncbi:unnamed protein product [Alopecurus aequalis]
MGDHYQTLGLQRDASKADIKNAYFRLAHRYHPDHHNHAGAAARAEAARRFGQAKDAYDVLSDYHRRADYDRNLRRPSSSSSSSGYRTSSSSSSSSKQGNRQGATSSSSSSKHGNQRGPPPPRPGGGSKLQNVLFGAYVVLWALGELVGEWQDVETVQREIHRMKMELQTRKQQWENRKREWKNKDWWTGIFRS